MATSALQPQRCGCSSNAMAAACTPRPPELYTFTMNVMQGRLRDAYINTWIEQHCTE
ncbi:MAG: hypothetical protein HC876_14485 [Chloroflexaceae bacterium]|nr:hypothetical protein [Chloroflexaceae bacterium]